MAKIKFGMMMTDARGKLGGQVFSKNRSGAYVRTKVTPVNPQTNDQQANRVMLGNLSQGWSGLTQAQRNAWNASVDQWQKTDIFGDLQKPTGKNLFTGLNKVAMSNFASASLMANPPYKTEFSAFVVTSIVFTESSGVKNITVSGVPTGSTFQVRATPPLTAGTTYFKNQLRGLGVALPTSETGVINFATPYHNKFGLPSAGGYVGIEIRQVADNGQLSAPYMALVPISA